MGWRNRDTRVLSAAWVALFCFFLKGTELPAAELSVGPAKIDGIWDARCTKRPTHPMHGWDYIRGAREYSVWDWFDGDEEFGASFEKAKEATPELADQVERALRSHKICLVNRSLGNTKRVKRNTPPAFFLASGKRVIALRGVDRVYLDQRAFQRRNKVRGRAVGNSWRLALRLAWGTRLEVLDWANADFSSLDTRVEKPSTEDFQTLERDLALLRMASIKEISSSAQKVLSYCTSDRFPYRELACVETLSQRSSEPLVRLAHLGCKTLMYSDRNEGCLLRALDRLVRSPDLSPEEPNSDDQEPWIRGIQACRDSSAMGQITTCYYGVLDWLVPEEIRTRTREACSYSGAVYAGAQADCEIELLPVAWKTRDLDLYTARPKLTTAVCGSASPDVRGDCYMRTVFNWNDSLGRAVNTGCREASHFGERTYCYGGSTSGCYSDSLYRQAQCIERLLGTLDEKGATPENAALYSCLNLVTSPYMELSCYTRVVPNLKIPALERLAERCEQLGKQDDMFSPEEVVDIQLRCFRVGLLRKDG